VRKNKAKAAPAPLEGSRTAANLRKAFAAEAALVFQHLYCATLAEYEGLDKASSLFKELAEGGTTTVHGCFDFLKLSADPESGLSIGSTTKNLELLLQSEAGLAGRSYPEMAAAARQEGLHDAASWFDTLAKLKRSHARKLKRLARG
jgi:rubrerythrin